jgi:carbon-monoxide dehydrogenase medium subunit
MIPAAFDYLRAGSVDEAVAALAEHGDEAKLLAGGQSLLPLLRLRLAYPSMVIDLTRVDELRGIRDDGDAIVIGAMTTHYDVMHDPLVREHCGVLAIATGLVGDPQVRNRGTLGGALAHADPAGDLPAVALALKAEMVVRGPGGERRLPAAEFFVDYLQSALAADEVLVAVRVPKLVGHWGYDYQKFHRVSQAWAIVGACAVVRRDNGSIAEARVGLTNMGATPIRAGDVETALQGVDVHGGRVREAAEQAAEGTSPPADLHAQPDYRKHLARVLTRRAVEHAVGG